MEEETVLDVGIKYLRECETSQMTRGMGGKGFFAGAIGGLALAVLLVGAVTLLPQTSIASRAPVANSFATSTTSSCSSCLAEGNPSQTSSLSSAALPSIASQAAPGGAAAIYASSTASQTSSSITPGTTTTSSLQAQQRPASLLGALPGEGVTNLIGTISPLIVGLLVAALVYAAYVRRQDWSS